MSAASRARHRQHRARARADCAARRHLDRRTENGPRAGGGGAQGKIGAIDDASFDAAPSSPYDRKIIRLAFLAPDLQATSLEGRQPVGAFRQRLINGEISAAWADQRRLFKSL